MSSYVTRRQTRSSENNNNSSASNTSSNVVANQSKLKRKWQAKKQEKKIVKKQKEVVKETTMKTQAAEGVYVDNTVQSLKLDCTIVAQNIQKQHFEPHYDAFVNFMYMTLGRHFHRSFFLKFPHVDITKPR